MIESKGHIMESFGKRLKTIRMEKGLSQSETAEKLGVSVQTVSRWECDSAMPDIVQIVPLAKLFGTTTDILLGFNADEDEEYRRAIIQNVKMNVGSGFGADPGDNIHEVRLEMFRRFCELFRRFPQKYEFANVIADSAGYIVEWIRLGMYDTLGEDDVKTIVAEAEKVLVPASKYAPDLSIREAAKIALSGLYAQVGDFAKAEAATAGLGIFERTIAQYSIASERKTESDFDDNIIRARKILHTNIARMRKSICRLIDAYGLPSKKGKPMRLPELRAALDLLDRFDDATADTDSAYWARKSNARLMRAAIHDSWGRTPELTDDIEAYADSLIKQYEQFVADRGIEHYSILAEPLLPDAMTLDDLALTDEEFANAAERLRGMIKYMTGTLIAPFAEAEAKDAEDEALRERIEGCAKRLRRCVGEGE